MKYYSLLLLLLIISCTPSDQKTTASDMTKDQKAKYAVDDHSFAKPEEAATSHLSLDIDVDFHKKIISGVATYDIIAQENARTIHFDSKGLIIKKVTVNGSKQEAKFNLIKGNDTHGDDLKIGFPANTKTVSIHYQTTAATEALQFLNPQQTADKKHPFLFTQGQAILTRTWIPIQDSPQLRLTYDAKVKVPKNLMAVMSAENPKKKSPTGEYHFKMKQAISPYLIALAIGDISYRKISDRTGVYAEHSIIESAEHEFQDVEKMVQAAEKLYGPYNWDQYDIIVLPPSFPFGGMENPRLTFATPTIIAGDRSLTTLVAHELAHSWSGNLVTNATWDDFWLNEGFTVYFERRIMEAVYGKEYSDMLAVMGRQDLDEELKLVHDHPEDSQLKLNLKGRNPDDGMTDIAYEKGFLFLKTIEKEVGRIKMDEFLKKYFKEHSFSTITTERFIEYLKSNLLEPNNASVNIDEWVYQSGIPANQVTITSHKFDDVENVTKEWISGKLSPKEVCQQDWKIQQKIHFIRNIPASASNAELKALDDACKFTNSTNSYIGMVWFEQTIKHDYHGNNVDEKIKNFLTNVGRRWYVTTIYRAMVNNGKKREAIAIYEEARKNYHSVTSGTVDKLLDFNNRITSQ